MTDAAIPFSGRRRRSPGQVLAITESSDTDLAGIGPHGGIQPSGPGARVRLGLAEDEPQQPLGGDAAFGRIQMF